MVQASMLNFMVLKIFNFMFLYHVCGLKFCLIHKGGLYESDSATVGYTNNYTEFES
jgi:hypothetical protein